MNDTIELVSEVAGFYTLELFRVDATGAEIKGSRRRPVPTFKNLITNAGLDRMGAFTDYTNFCQVGSGATPPAVGDSGLVAKVAGVGTPVSRVTANQPSAPYYASTTKTFEFGVGVAAGNLSEVGIGWADTGSLFSRALIVDGSGSPTTITVLPDEILQVTYQLRYYAPTVDNSGNLTLNGVSTDWVSRASNVTVAVGGWNSPGDTSAGFDSTSSYQRVHDGVVSADVTSSPSGTQSERTSASDAAYSAGSYARSGNCVWGLAQGNFATGIKSAFVRHGVGSYQIGFTPAIMKTSSQVLTLTFRHAWARKAL